MAQQNETLTLILLPPHSQQNNPDQRLWGDVKPVIAEQLPQNRHDLKRKPWRSCGVSRNYPISSADFSATPIADALDGDDCVLVLMRATVEHADRPLRMTRADIDWTNVIYQQQNIIAGKGTSPLLFYSVIGIAPACHCSNHVVISRKSETRVVQ